MKRLPTIAVAVAVLLAVVLFFTLCSGGNGGGSDPKPTDPPAGNSPTDPTDPNDQESSVAGYYRLVGIEDNGEYTDVLDITDAPDTISYVVMNEDKSAIVYMEYEKYEMTYNGSSFVDVGGDAIDYDLNDKELRLYVEESMTFHYVWNAESKPDLDEPELEGDPFPEEIVEQLEGDWHGWCEITDGDGMFIDAIDTSFEIIARFVFDENGNCQPFMAICTDDPDDNIKELIFAYNSEMETVDFVGRIFGVDISYGEVMVYEDGFADCYMMVDDGENDRASIMFGMRRIGDTWDEDSDDPCIPQDVLSQYEGLDLIDIAELYGVDLDLIPEA